MRWVAWVLAAAMLANVAMAVDEQEAKRQAGFDIAKRVIPKTTKGWSTSRLDFPRDFTAADLDLESVRVWREKRLQFDGDPEQATIVVVEGTLNGFNGKYAVYMWLNDGAYEPILVMLGGKHQLLSKTWSDAEKNKRIWAAFQELEDERRKERADAEKAELTVRAYEKGKSAFNDALSKAGVSVMKLKKSDVLQQAQKSALEVKKQYREHFARGFVDAFEEEKKSAQLKK